MHLTAARTVTRTVDDGRFPTFHLGIYSASNPQLALGAMILHPGTGAQER